MSNDKPETEDVGSDEEEKKRRMVTKTRRLRRSTLSKKN